MPRIVHPSQSDDERRLGWINALSTLVLAWSVVTAFVGVVVTFVLFSHRGERVSDAGIVTRVNDLTGWGWACLAGTIGTAAVFALIGMLGRYFVTQQRTLIWQRVRKAEISG